MPSSEIEHFAWAVEIARYPLDTVGGAQLLGQALDPLAKRRILRGELLRADDHEFVEPIALGESLVDQVLGLL